jgi:probable HAF family extracellular repeat protein
MVGLGDVPGGRFYSTANGISADGSVVVGYGTSSSGTYEAFRWTEAGGMVGLGDELFFSEANGASADGSVVVGTSSSSSAPAAFRWTEVGGMVGLGDLPGGGFFSTAYGISADGTVVVGRGSSSSGTGEAFRWTEAGGMVGLGDLPGGGFLSNAYGTSADGSVVVGQGNSSSGYEAFVWDETNGMRALIQILADQGIDMTGWNLTDAMGISAYGLTIVGSGTNPSGFGEAWIATIPEPGTATLVGMGLVSLSVFGRRRRHRRVAL